MSKPCHYRQGFLLFALREKNIFAQIFTLHILSIDSLNICSYIISAYLTLI